MKWTPARDGDTTAGDALVLLDGKTVRALAHPWAESVDGIITAQGWRWQVVDGDRGSVDTLEQAQAAAEAAHKAALAALSGGSP